MTTPMDPEDGGRSGGGFKWEPRTYGDAPSPPPEDSPVAPADADGQPEDSGPGTPNYPPAPPEAVAQDEPLAPDAGVPPLPGEPPVPSLAVPPSPGEPPPPVPPAPPIPVPPEPVPAERYPMRFDIAYPEGMSRWKTLLRLFLVIPPYLILQLLNYFLYAGAFLGFTTVFWRKKYPDWLFSGISGALGFQARTHAYALLLTDKFPSFSREESPVTLEYDPPPSGYLSRWRVFFWKLILIIPHLIVLMFLSLALFVVTVLAWFGILFTGNYPRGLFQFGTGIQRWYYRVAGYFLSFNDRYPPYSLSSESGPASNAATVSSGIGGLVVVGIFGAIITAAIVASTSSYTAHMDYEALKAGQQQPTYRFSAVFASEDAPSSALTLLKAVDPGNSLVQVLPPASDERIIVVQWRLRNSTSTSDLVPRDAASIKVHYEDDSGKTKTKTIGAAIVTVNNVSAPARVGSARTATIQAVFVVPKSAEPVELRFSGGFSRGGVHYKFDQ
jgi:hypothetical protein